MNKDEAALRGYVEVPCTQRGGTTCVIKVRIVKISEIEVYLDVALEEEKAIKMTILEPVDFDTDTLTDASYEELLRVSTELNFTRALEMMQKRMSRAEKTGQGLKATLESMASLLRKYAPQSLSAADIPTTKSET